jgi:hypothetical protein
MSIVGMACAAFGGLVILIFLVGWLAFGSNEFDALVGRKILAVLHALRGGKT